jgi:purine nucleosidase
MGRAELSQLAGYSCRRMKQMIKTLAVQILLAAAVTFSTNFSCWAKAQVILSTDVGNEIDDQWVVAYLLVDHQDFEVVGMISAHAPTLPDPSAHYTYLVLRDEVENRLGMAQHPPLFEGSSMPLPTVNIPEPNAGVNFIISSSKHFSSAHRLTVLTIGAATDVASAIIEDPGIVQRIRVVAMGFKSWPQGADEFNVANDVHAWQVILDSQVPVVIGCGDVCRANLSLTLSQARNLISKHGPVGAWLWSEFQDWYYRYVKPLRVNDFSKSWVIWDMITAAYVNGYTNHVDYARPRLTDAMQFEQGSNSSNIVWITHVDAKRLWQDFVLTLDAYERTHKLLSTTNCCGIR